MSDLNKEIGEIKEAILRILKGNDPGHEGVEMETLMRCIKCYTASPEMLQLALQALETAGKIFMKGDKLHWKNMSGLTLQTKSKPHYSNNTVLHPNGAPMFRCSDKRIDWYLNKKLADLVEDGEVRTIQLNFIPGGGGWHGNEYFMADKENICVCCGTDADLTSHHVVPREFRVHFPPKYVVHNHHDVLLMCADCHTQYELKSSNFKNHLFQKYNINTVPFRLSEETRRECTAMGKAISVRRYGSSIPTDILERLKIEAGDYINMEIDEMESLRYEMIKKERAGIVGRGEQLVLKLDDIEAFCQLWRTHFVEYATPKFLPDKWDINFNVYVDC